MKAWRAKYAAAAIYIGGQMMACGQSNLSTRWVQQAEAMGYALMPTFVGLQAPCDSFSGKIDPKQAAAQGTAAANQAVTAAKSYGLGAGTPIYYDMEAYDHTNARCRTAVLTFLDAWTRQLKASATSGRVLQRRRRDQGPAVERPPSPGTRWPSRRPSGSPSGTTRNDMTGAPYMTSAVWPVASRSKQYQATRWSRWAGSR